MSKLPKEDIDYIRKRVNEIIKDYAYDDGESYVRIDLYFEKSNGESQEKTLVCGKPSCITPDELRDFPEGYLNGLNENEMYFTLEEMLETEIKWKYHNGKYWDGTTLKEMRAKKNVQT